MWIKKTVLHEREPKATEVGGHQRPDPGRLAPRSARKYSSVDMCLDCHGLTPCKGAQLFGKCPSVEFTSQQHGHPGLSRFGCCHDVQGEAVHCDQPACRAEGGGLICEQHLFRIDDFIMRYSLDPLESCVKQMRAFALCPGMKNADKRYRTASREVKHTLGDPQFGR